jgi:hypothetical protein
MHRHHPNDEMYADLARSCYRAALALLHETGALALSPTALAKALSWDSSRVAPGTIRLVPAPPDSVDSDSPP